MHNPLTRFVTHASSNGSVILSKPAIASVIAFVSVILSVSPARADTPEEAVRKGRDGQIGMTDIAGDGLNVLPVKVENRDGTIILSGVIRHTYRPPLEHTLIDYSVTINSAGAVEGSLTINPARNGDRIETRIQGTVTGKAGQIEASVLKDARWKNGVKALLNILTTQVTVAAKKPATKASD